MRHMLDKHDELQRMPTVGRPPFPTAEDLAPRRAFVYPQKRPDPELSPAFISPSEIKFTGPPNDAQISAAAEALIAAQDGRTQLEITLDSLTIPDHQALIDEILRVAAKIRESRRAVEAATVVFSSVFSTADDNECDCDECRPHLGYWYAEEGEDDGGF
jgi:hypothetical protein